MSGSVWTPGVSEDELPAGTSLAGYELVRVTRRAEAHTLYEGVSSGYRVTVKLLGRAPSRDPSFRERAEELLARRASVEHRHLLPVLESGQFVEPGGRERTRLYVVSRFSDAPTLGELLTGRPFAAEGTLRLLGQVAEALDAAHARGLAHPGLAPAEILVEGRYGGHVLVADCIGGDGLDSSSYSPPEALRGEPPTAAGDVYSLTCILVECLTGAPPNQRSVWDAHGARSSPRRGQLPDGLPPGLERVARVGLADDPAQRFPSCDALVAAAAAAVEERPGATLPASPGAGEVDPWSRAGTRGRVGPAVPAAGPAPEAAGPAAEAASPAPAARPAPASGPVRAAAGPAAERLEAAEPHRWRTARSLLLALGAGALLGGGVALLGAGDEEAAPQSERAEVAPARADSERAALIRRASGPVERLASERAAGRRRLAQARGPGAQAAAAERLSRAYARAADGLDRAGAEDLAAAARRGAAAHRRLAAAARGGERSGWRAAAGAVRRADAGLERGLGSLRGP